MDGWASRMLCTRGKVGSDGRLGPPCAAVRAPVAQASRATSGDEGGGRDALEGAVKRRRLRALSQFHSVVSLPPYSLPVGACTTSGANFCL